MIFMIEFQTLTIHSNTNFFTTFHYLPLIFPFFLSPSLSLWQKFFCSVIVLVFPFPYLSLSPQLSVPYWRPVFLLLVTIAFGYLIFSLEVSLYPIYRNDYWKSIPLWNHSTWFSLDKSTWQQSCLTSSLLIFSILLCISMIQNG